MTHIGVATDGKDLDENPTIEGYGVRVQLFFDILGMHPWFIEPGRVLNVDDTFVGNDRHNARVI